VKKIECDDIRVLNDIWNYCCDTVRIWSQVGVVAVGVYREIFELSL
jgi:hypothetical protein